MLTLRDSQGAHVSIPQAFEAKRCLLVLHQLFVIHGQDMTPLVETGKPSTPAHLMSRNVLWCFVRKLRIVLKKRSVIRSVVNDAVTPSILEHSCYIMKEVWSVDLSIRVTLRQNAQCAQGFTVTPSAFERSCYIMTERWSVDLSIRVTLLHYIVTLRRNAQVWARLYN
jgi:hypothetical protein